MRRFKYLRNIQKSYEQQGEIFFCCRNYAQKSKRVQDKIRRLCQEAGGEHAEALFCYLTTDISWQEAAMRFYISERTLQRCRDRFYELW